MSRITKSVDLGFILSSIPQSDFKLDKFSDRLRLQKIIYSIQMFGVHLGYDFSWCIRGPYCTKLAKAGRELNVFYDEIPKDIEIGFRDDNDQKAFIRAKNFMKKLDKMLKKTDLDFTDKIEIAASIHNLYTDRKMMYDSIIEKVSSKHIKFKSKYCIKIWDVMKEEQLLVNDDNQDVIHPGGKQTSSIHSMWTANMGKMFLSANEIGTIKNTWNKLENYDDLALMDIMTDTIKCKEFEINNKLMSTNSLKYHKHAQLNSHKTKEKLLSKVLFNDL